MTIQTTACPPHAREHHWDALRALLMLLGIPYHVAMTYRADEVWILTSGQGAPVFNAIAQAIHVFRMPAFFIVAGYFAALLLARRAPGPWLKGRLVRLAIPLVAALLTLNPLLNLLCEISNLGWPGALPSWKHESLTSGGYGIRHLWFLIVLLYLSGAAALAHRISPGLAHATLRPAWDAWLARHFEVSLIAIALLLGLWMGGAIELFYVAGLATQLPQQILRLDQLIEFAPWFLIGALIARAPALKAALYRFSLPIALLSIAALALDLAFREQLWPPYGRFLDTLAAVGLSQLLIATIKRFADRPSPLVQEIVKASFVIYLFHLPILTGLVILGKMLILPLALKAGLLMMLTLALSWGVWLIVRRSPALRLLYDGTRPPQIARPPAPRVLSRQGA
ncbi:acyltransferase family protein [Sphingobium nicotianae]|uniref:Acyltransferase family protein n=1 Tax=Sphingobium nicotianae TaxID=2782607 RepID=A0A9X1IRL0_9SPHN|nr:acyltransferase family protein [Sphingobium nicotianae]